MKNRALLSERGCLAPHKRCNPRRQRGSNSGASEHEGRNDNQQTSMCLDPQIPFFAEEQRHEGVAKDVPEHKPSEAADEDNQNVEHEVTSMRCGVKILCEKVAKPLVVNQGSYKPC